MKATKLFDVSGVASASVTASHTTGQGRLNGLVLFYSEVIYKADVISIKTRTKSNVYPHATNMSVRKLASLSDLSFGLRASGALNGVVREMLNATDATVDANKIFPDAKYGQFVPMLGTSVRCVYIPLGHITLGNAELEVSLQTSSGSTAQNVAVYAIHSEFKPDNYLIYDETKDFDSTHNSVREIYFASEDYLITEAGEKSLSIQLDYPDQTTDLLDTRGILGITNLFSNVEGMPEMKTVRLFRDTMPVPSSVRAKITGADSAVDSLIYIKELLSEQTSTSTIDNLNEMTKRVEKLERENSDLAKRYRHAGITDKSQDMKKVKAELEASNEADKKGLN